MTKEEDAYKLFSGITNDAKQREIEEARSCGFILGFLCASVIIGFAAFSLL